MPNYIYYVNPDYGQKAYTAFTVLADYVIDHSEYVWSIRKANYERFSETGLLIGPERAFRSLHRQIELANLLKAGEATNPLAEFVALMDDCGVDRRGKGTPLAV
ncbi:hypothetical protein KOAAANKH_01688 [Brevundimonas sp. NIBR10]|uniref:hypothetical protein n=1 Tax=Brevundimonas sp. NIBR10 TaxID=3015997 RepID=UPI0022F1AAC0|nr:hypothetical protein [Brevundimonas sp. NIBR10]WGM46814.1 hypothetical protein KOAAANKH_01688 [Brevundimonas sp. NIBR10]